MTDVFVRTCAESDLRCHLLRAVVARIDMMPNVRLEVLDAATNMLAPRRVCMSRYDFWETSRTVAERMAVSDPFVLIDDDQLPVGKTWLEDGLAAMEAHPEYCMLSSWSVNGEVLERPGNGLAWDMSHTSTGTPCFVRKGTFVDLPAGELATYDGTLCDWLRGQGKRFGFLRHVRHNHLGYGYSQAVPGHWGA